MKKSLIILCFILSNSFAQQSFQQSIKYRFEAGSYFSLTNQLPFWHSTNQYGSIPSETPAVFIKQSIHSRKDSSLNNRLSYGFEGNTIIGKKSQLIFPEYYLDYRLGKIHIWAGRKKEIIGLIDTTLSSGSITWSGNALPIPKAQIDIPTYTKLFFNWLAFKGSYAHGWFGNQTFAKGYYLHQKTLFFQLGKPTARIKLYGGFVHNVQWGGYPKYILPPNSDRLYNGKFPEDWFVYANAVIPLKKIWQENPKYANYNYFERGNRFGNHLGSIDLGSEIRFNQGKLLIYKQSIFEDGQLFNLTNADDGLYGLSFKPNESVFKNFVFEYLNTKNQGHYLSGIAKLLGLVDRHPNEQNFYFNHAQYYDGWSYNRKTIGTPFLTPQENLRMEKRDENGGIFVNNNRISAFYVGIDNQLGSVRMINRFSYSKNFGAYDLHFTPVTQISYCVGTQIPIQAIKSTLNVNIAVDHGDLIKDNFGGYVSFIKAW